MPNKHDKEFFERSIDFDLSRANKQDRTIPITISTENPVDTWRGPEVLIHTKEAVDFSRSGNGIPLLVEHDTKNMIGRVTDVKLKGKKLVGLAKFSRSAKAQDYYQDVVDKIITDVSIGGQRLKVVPVEKGINVTRWRPLECSLTAIGGDSQAGIRRNYKHLLEESIMGEENTEATTTKEKKVDSDEMIQRGVKLEQTRQTAINDNFERFLTIEGVTDLKTKALADSYTIERANKELLTLVGDNHEPIEKTPANMYQYGKDEKEKFADGMQRSLEFKVGVATEKEIEDIGQNQFTSFSMVEMARHYLGMNGCKINGFSRLQILGDAFTRGAILGSATSSDFPNILANVAQKSMLKGYNEVPET